MKIISGPPVFQNRKITCRGSSSACGAELEIEFSDLKRKHYPGDFRDQRDGPFDDVFVNCPACGQKLMINDVPGYLVSRIPEDK